MRATIEHHKPFYRAALGLWKRGGNTFIAEHASLKSPEEASKTVIRCLFLKDDCPCLSPQTLVLCFMYSSVIASTRNEYNSRGLSPDFFSIKSAALSMSNYENMYQFDVTEKLRPKRLSKDSIKFDQTSRTWSIYWEAFASTTLDEKELPLFESTQHRVGEKLRFNNFRS